MVHRLVGQIGYTESVYTPVLEPFRQCRVVSFLSTGAACLGRVRGAKMKDESGTGEYFTPLVRATRKPLGGAMRSSGHSANGPANHANCNDLRPGCNQVPQVAVVVVLRKSVNTEGFRVKQRKSHFQCGR